MVVNHSDTAHPLPPGPVATAATLLAELDDPRPDVGSPRFATGFQPLDDALRGGVQPHELVVLGGHPGVGKSVTALQWARRMAMRGQTVVYVDFQHSLTALLRRLLAIELASLARVDERTTLSRVQMLGEEVVLGARPADALTADPLGDEAVHRLGDYGARLHFVAGSSRATGIVELADIVANHRDGPTALFVDSIQSLPTANPIVGTDTVTGESAAALKELAMVANVPVFALAAAGRAGLGVRRLRLRHLDGAPAIAHEADVAILLNDKSEIMNTSHSDLDRARSTARHGRVVFSIEKHRTGGAGLDLEFRKDFANARFDPEGRFVTDTLVTE